MKMSRETHSLLKIIKIGSTIFLKTQNNRKEHLIIKMKMSRVIHLLLKVIKIGNTVFFKTQENRKEYLGKVCYRHNTN